MPGSRFEDSRDHYLRPGIEIFLQTETASSSRGIRTCRTPATSRPRFESSARRCPTSCPSPPPESALLLFTTTALFLILLAGPLLAPFCCHSRRCPGRKIFLSICTGSARPRVEATVVRELVLRKLLRRAAYWYVRHIGLVMRGHTAAPCAAGTRATPTADSQCTPYAHPHRVVLEPSSE